jgi:hypothetical protein
MGQHIPQVGLRQKNELSDITIMLIPGQISNI